MQGRTQEFPVTLRATPCVPVSHDRLSVSSETTGCGSGRAQCFLSNSPPVLREEEHPPHLLRWKFLQNPDRNPGKGRGWMVNRGSTVAWGSHLPAGGRFVHFPAFQHEPRGWWCIYSCPHEPAGIWRLHIALLSLEMFLILSQMQTARGKRGL